MIIKIQDVEDKTPDSAPLESIVHQSTIVCTIHCLFEGGPHSNQSGLELERDKNIYEGHEMRLACIQR